MVAALLTSERIKTTEVKAKEIKRLAERAITWARRLGDILNKKPENRSQEERERVLHSIRMALRTVRDRTAVIKLFEEIAPRFLNRHGGYTRIIKIQPRAGDSAPMAILELVSSEDTGSKDKGEASKGTTKSSKETKIKATKKSANEKPKKQEKSKSPVKNKKTTKKK
jgi:large subunit ribosomal protein L17